MVIWGETLTAFMKTINDINFKGKRALIRVDFNVPLDKAFNVTDDNRIRATIPTLKKILNDGGSCVLMSHLGRPKEGPEEKYSLKHTLATTEKLLEDPFNLLPIVLVKKQEQKQRI